MKLLTNFAHQPDRATTIDEGDAVLVEGLGEFTGSCHVCRRLAGGSTAEDADYSLLWLCRGRGCAIGTSLRCRASRNHVKSELCRHGSDQTEALLKRAREKIPNWWSTSPLLLSARAREQTLGCSESFMLVFCVLCVLTWPGCR